MGQELWTAVSDYLEKLFVPHDPAMENILAASDAAGLPSISVTPLEGKLLTLLPQIRDARRILGIGTLGGYTARFARGRAQGGLIITLDHCDSDSRKQRLRRPRLGRSHRRCIIPAGSNSRRQSRAA